MGKDNNLLITALVLFVATVFVVSFVSGGMNITGYAFKELPTPEKEDYGSRFSEERQNGKISTLLQADIDKLSNEATLFTNIMNDLKNWQLNQEENLYCSQAESIAQAKAGLIPDLDKEEYVECIDPDKNSLSPFKKASNIYVYSVYEITPDYSFYPTPAPTEYKVLKQGCNIIPDMCKTLKEGDSPFLYEAECDPVKNLPSYRAINCQQKFGENYVCLNGECAIEVLEIVYECGNGLVEEEEECDDGNTINDDGCSEDCLYELQPNIIVGVIPQNALSEFCVNFYSFEICNIGEAPVNQPFMIKMEANGKDSIFEYDASAQPLDVFDCVMIKNPPKTHIYKFTDLDSTDEVTITVDVNEDIAEMDEEDNEKTEEIYSGDSYYYEPGNYEDDNICSAWCYDSDDGKDYWTYGETSFLYNQYIDHDQDECDKYFHYKNNAILTEEYCLSPMQKLDNNLFPYPSLKKQVDCTLLDAKCEGGKCVPIDENHLSCWDPEGDTNIWVYGEVDYTTIDGEDLILPDVCSNEEILHEYHCDSDELADYFPINCIYENALCEDGKCVETNGSNECIDHDPGDTNLIAGNPWLAGNLEFNKLNGETDWHDDYCSFDRTIVYQYECITPVNPPNKEGYDCTQEENEFGAALCDEGVCVLPNPEWMECKETEDEGLDYYTKGKVESTSMHNIDDVNFDTCLQGTNLLIEYYCVGEELQMTPPYDCGMEGLTCHAGRCVNPDENLKACEEEVVGDWTYYHSTNEFGETSIKENHCIEDDVSEEFWDWETESNYLVEFNCDGVDLDYEIIDCTEQDKVCHKGECKVKDDNLKDCIPDEDEPDSADPYTSGTITVIDAFGDVDFKSDYCKNPDELKERFCDGVEDDSETIDCTEFGMKCFASKCMTPNPELKTCEIVGGYQWPWGQVEKVDFTNEFGENTLITNTCRDEYYYQDYLDELEYADTDTDIEDANNWFFFSGGSDDGPYMIDYGCDGNDITYELIDCTEQGKTCYEGMCVEEDPALEQCIDNAGGEEIEPDDPFLEGYTEYYNAFGIEEGHWDYCKNDEKVKEFYCVGDAIVYDTIDCTDYGMLCNDMTGSCEEYDENLEGCFETDNGFFPEIPSYAYITNAFGSIEGDGFEKCKDDDTVKELWCIGDNDGDEENVDCEGNKICRNFCDDDGLMGAACTDPDNEENLCLEEVAEEEVIEEVPEEP
ncbi:hypothetical protein HN695_01000 [Candidatus Woesearchaeota archaeon]|jgi:cysteine-rich repeat protein|nr:hypothetical protein [Candidatus Woesearchaeota archaeon]MBT5272750.1 hypothetical protein [Candidatus Woesearchaeota archaeon]MBT6040361.1 hypothetical protein [Candidatus Woesearchaeota archaeon]MBT6337005.1 hypothetical protein [Candidatus Woesearchaeota archaeon]MBT7926891.1 hypothetical protein [Candidatus Woesearchaeota archaeon]